MSSQPAFSVALAPDFAPDAPGVIPDSFGLQPLLQAQQIATEVAAMGEALPRPLADLHDAVLLMDQRVDTNAIAGSERLRLVARYGVGTNSVDLDACADNGVMVTVTPEGVTRPVASAALTLIMATTLRLPEKSTILRSGDWSTRGGVVGIGLTDRKVGIVGLGRTGRELARLVRPFGARVFAYDPYVDASGAADLGVTLVGLDELFDDVDIVCLLAALTPETHHLLSRERIAALKPTAIVVNVSRGPLIDEEALIEAIEARAVGGAGLDVLENEPLSVDSRLLALSASRNVVLTPHSLCWTDECFNGNGGSAAQAILDLQAGLVPLHVANPRVLSHPRFSALVRR